MLWLRSFKRLIMPMKEQQEKYKISIEKSTKAERSLPELFVSFLDAQAGLLAQES